MSCRPGFGRSLCGSQQCFPGLRLQDGAQAMLAKGRGDNTTLHSANVREHGRALSWDLPESRTHEATLPSFPEGTASFSHRTCLGERALWPRTRGLGHS